MQSNVLWTKSMINGMSVPQHGLLPRIVGLSALKTRKISKLCRRKANKVRSAIFEQMCCKYTF